MANDQQSDMLTAIQAALTRMEERLSIACSNVEDLKKNRQKAAQHHLYITTVVWYTIPQHKVLNLCQPAAVVVSMTKLLLV